MARGLLGGDGLEWTGTDGFLAGETEREGERGREREMERAIMGGGDKISWALMSITHMVNSHKYFMNIPIFTFHWSCASSKQLQNTVYPKGKLYNNN